MPTQFTGSYIVPPDKSDGSVDAISFQKIKNVMDFDKKARAIIIPTLKAEYFMLFTSIDLIVTAKGSALAHLAILGREHHMPIFLCADVFTNAPKSGRLKIEQNTEDRSKELEYRLQLF